MENEMKQEPEALTTEETVAVEVSEAPKSPDIKEKACAFFETIKNTITIGEVVLFIAAYVGVGLIDLCAKSFGIPLAINSVFALSIAVAFAIAFWMSRDGARPISSFLYSLSTIGMLMLSVTLITSLELGLKDATLVSIVSAVTLIISVFYLYISKNLKNSGSSFVLGSVAAFGFAIFIAAQLSNIPCGNALTSGSENATKICQATPYFQNILILVPLFALGYFGMMPKK